MAMPADNRGHVGIVICPGFDAGRRFSIADQISSCSGPKSSECRRVPLPSGEEPRGQVREIFELPQSFDHPISAKSAAILFRSASPRTRIENWELRIENWSDEFVNYSILNSHPRGS